MASESYKKYEGDVSALPKCKDCGVRPTRMDLHMQGHKSSPNKSEALKKKKGHVYERTMHGGFEKVRENVSPDEFKKHFSAKHKIGEVKGKPKYDYR